MSVDSPIRFSVVFAVSMILLILLGLTVKRNAALRLDNGRLHVAAADLNKKLDSAVSERDTLRVESAGFPARLIAATNAAVSLTVTQYSQVALHEKLRAEIARLSEDNVLKDTALDNLRAQSAAARQEQWRTEEALRLAQNSAAAASNELTRIRASEADKATRLAQREQELAAKVSELATAKKAALQAAAAQGTAEQNAKAAQAELATLKARVAELEAVKAKAVVKEAP